jgi:predicted pyridoxine 5'-phosphate oxidase superfamily flavin-nucleotide-binding protein
MRSMGKVFDAIDDKLAAWIGRQRMFFVGTAPSGDGGHVNVSPKGPIESLRILDPHTVAYEDVIGSGAETIAHLRENGRIVVMLCAFEGPPRILRLHGRGTVLPVDAVDFPGTDVASDAKRAVIRVDVERIADSCGYGVPVMQYVSTRPQYAAWVDAKLRKGGEHALEEYVAEKNARSIDGLPAVDAANLEPA